MSAMRLLSLLLVSLFSSVAFAQDRFTLELEGGPAWQLRNDFAVPGDGGTLVRTEDRGPAVAFRATATWRVSERWSVRALAAPLSTSSDVVSQSPIVFEGATFAPGAPVRTEYEFNSWRAGAFYSFAPRGKWSFRAGGTLKVRDARIALSRDGASAEKTNVGVVPLLYAGARFQASPRLAFDVDADGAAASQGRALDVAARVESALTGRVALYGGLRLLEGGADNDEVYSFGTFAYATGGLRLRW
jgi:hypothetical protein